MLSIEHCREKLEKYGKKYSDDQIREIRKTLYKLAECQIHDNNTREQNENNINEKCNSLYESIYR